MKELIEKLLANDPALTEIDILEIINSNQIQENDENWEAFCRALSINDKVRTLKFGKRSVIFDFSAFSIIHWNFLFEAITSNKSLINIDFEDLSFNEIDINIFTAFMKALTENKTINRYYFEPKTAYIADMDKEHWEAFALLAKSKEIHLDMWQLLAAYEDNEWDCFYQTMKQGNFVFLGLNENGLDTLDTNHWKQLCEIIACSPSLNCIELENNNLGSISSSRMKLLCESFSKNKALVELRIGENDFNHGKAECWPIFCNFLANANHIKTLQFNYGDLPELFLFSDSKQYFCDALIKNQSLREIDLRNNKLNELESKVFKDLMNAIQNSKIESLILRECNLDELSEDSWKYFCNMIDQNNHLKHLDIGGAGMLSAVIGENDNGDERFKLFCSALKKNPKIGKNVSLISLNIDENDLDVITEENRKLLYDSLNTCELLSKIELDGNQAYQDKVKKIPIMNTKGIFFAAAHSIIGNSNNDNAQKKIAKDNQALRKLPVLPNDCIYHILEFLPINFLPRKKAATKREEQAHLLRESALKAAHRI